MANLFWQDDPAPATKSSASNMSKNEYLDVKFATAFLEQIKTISERGIPFNLSPAISEEEWYSSNSSPNCIVENWFYEDVGVFVAPGGTGKTTLILFEAVHIVLGIPLFEYHVINPGPVLILTAEDSRESLIARLRFICNQLHLSDEEIAKVRQEVIITDVSGSGFKLTTVERDTVVPSRNAEQFIRAAADIHPALVVIDPAVSFGVGESRVNDAEQGLIEAGRKLRNELKCAVIYVHHTGKANGREKTLDQYSGRGGSAFADGSRMVHVLQSVTSQDWLKATSDELQDGEFGFVLARPKISYATPQPHVYLKRKGHIFTRYDHIEDRTIALHSEAEKVWRFLKDELSQGLKNSRRSLQDKMDLSQGGIRSAVDRLILDGRLEDADLTTTGRRGGMRSYLRPIDINGPE